MKTLTKDDFFSVFNARKTSACVIGPLMKQGLDSASHLAVPLIKTRPRLFAFFPCVLLHTHE